MFILDEDNYTDEDDPWKGISSVAEFLAQSTFHTEIEISPGQLVFR